MHKELLAVREALEYTLEVTPNFNIQHKTQKALATLDRVIEGMEGKLSQYDRAMLMKINMILCINENIKQPKTIDDLMVTVARTELVELCKFAKAKAVLAYLAISTPPEENSGL